MRKFSNTVCLAVDITEGIANIAGANDVLVAIVSERENYADGEGRQVPVNFEDEVLCFPEATKETHEHLAGVLHGVA